MASERLTRFGNNIQGLWQRKDAYWERRHDVETLLFPAGKLRQINWYLTHICDHQCGSCKVPDYREIKPMSDSDRAEALKRLRSLSRPGALLSIIGGEPLMTPLLAKKAVADATGEGFFVSLVTNGDNLTPELIYELGKEGLKYLNISFDPMHGNNDPENEQRVFDLLNYANEIGIVPVINTVITRATDPDRFNAFAARVLGVGLFINPIVCSPAISDGRFAKSPIDVVPTSEQLRKIIPQLLDQKRITGRVATGGQTLKSLLNLGVNQDEDVLLWHCLPHFRHLRNQGRGHLAMDSDGYVGPCQEFARQLDLLHINGRLSLRTLDKEFSKITAGNKCQGCLFTCYMTEESVIGLAAALEEKESAVAMMQVLTRRHFS